MQDVVWKYIYLLLGLSAVLVTALFFLKISYHPYDLRWQNQKNDLQLAFHLIDEHSIDDTIHVSI